MMDMRILYIGAESANWIINLCNKFCEQGADVTCVVQQSDEYDKENPVKEHKKLTRINIENGKFFEPNFVFNKLLLPVKQNNFDIVFGSHMPVSPLVKGLAEKLNVPWGIMVLDIPTDLMRVDRRRMRNWLYWFDVCKYADTMIFNTRVARDEYEKFTSQYFFDDHIIPYAINMPAKYDMAGVDVKGDYILSICRLTPIKNCRDRKSTRLNSSHTDISRMPSSA